MALHKSLKHISCNTGFRRFYSTNLAAAAQSTRDSEQNINDEVSTAIIGGGISGTSLAYHLAKQGEKDVVLLEKTELTAGSTWHAAGLTTFFNAGINLKKIHYYSLNLYSQLAKETGQETGFHQCGSIRIAFSKEKLNEFKFQMSRSRIHDAPHCLLTPEEVVKMAPIVNPNKLLMGLYTPGDGHIDPYSLTQALAKGARKYGAKIHQHTPVTSLTLRDDNRWLVGTSKGHFIADRIVNAAGFWSREVSKMAGYELPALTNQHQYLVTSPMPEIQAFSWEMPVLRHLDGSSYIRQEKDGLVIGPYESTERMVSNNDWNLKQVPEGFGRELFQSDVDRMMPHLERLMEDIPCMSTMKIQSIVNGPIHFSPDGLPLVGPEDIPNVWTMSAINYGIVHGGGMGKYLADWIQNGEPSFDLNECDPTRYQNWASDEYIISKCRESYGMMNHVIYPHDERFAGRPTKRVTPAYSLQKERGAHMQIHGGWEQPAWFALKGQKAEYIPSFFRTNWHAAVGSEWELVTTRAGIIDLTPFAKIIVEGEDADKFIHRITANSVPKVGRTVISHMLTPSAKVYAELTITKTDENRFFIITGSGSEVHDLRWMNELARKGNLSVNIQNVTDQVGCLSIAGPKSKDVLAKLSPRFEKQFSFLSMDNVNIAGMQTTAMRLSYTGELGWELYHPVESTGKLYEALLSAGEEFGIGDFGTICLNTLRLEKGFNMWGNEMNLDKNPLQANLMAFINFKKDDFIGKSALMELKKVQPLSQLVMIKLHASAITDPIGDEAIWCAGKIVGNTTSGAFSYHLQSPLAFAYLPPFLSTPGSKIQVELMGEMVDSEVLPRAPVLTYNEKMKAKTQTFRK